MCTHTHTHTHTMEYYSGTKKNEILPFEKTGMDLQGIMIILTERSQIEKDNYCILTLICGIEKKTKQMNNYNKAETNSQV